MKMYPVIMGATDMRHMLADLQASKLTVQFGRVNLQRKSPWRARTPGA